MGDLISNDIPRNLRGFSRTLESENCVIDITRTVLVQRMRWYIIKQNRVLKHWEGFLPRENKIVAPTQAQKAISNVITFFLIASMPTFFGKT